MIRLIISFILAVIFLQVNVFLGLMFIALAIFAYKIKDKKFDVPQQPTNRKKMDEVIDDEFISSNYTYDYLNPFSNHD